jgi:autotransporter-associated beta strand protein
VGTLAVSKTFHTKNASTEKIQNFCHITPCMGHAQLQYSSFLNRFYPHIAHQLFQSIMKSCNQALRSWLLALSAGTCLSSTLFVQGTEYTWDTGVADGIQTTSHNWSTTATNWTADGGITRVVWQNTGFDDALITGGVLPADISISLNSDDIQLDDLTTTYSAESGIRFCFLNQLANASLRRNLTLTGGSYDGTGSTGSQFNIGSGGGLTFGGVAGTTQFKLTGASDVVKLGGGSLFFSSVDNDFIGNIHINSGIVYVNSGSDYSLGNAANDIYINSGTLSAQNNAITFSSGRTIHLGGSGGKIGAVSVTMTLQGLVTGAGSMEKVGSGTVVLESVSDYSGATTITSGTLRLGSNGTIPNFSNTTINGGGIFGVRNTANWTYNGTISGDCTGALNLNTGTNATLAGDVAGVLIVNVGTTGTHATISGAISGATNVNVSDVGASLRLSGGNSYSGDTVINSGTLMVEGAGSISNSAVTIDDGGTFRYNSSVAYTGTLNFNSGIISGTNLTGSLGNITVGTSQTLSPGNSPGTAVTTSQTWASGGSYLWEINNATGTEGTDSGWDLLTGSGTLDISATGDSKFNLLVTSLGTDNLSGIASNFDGTIDYFWKIADFATVTNFAADAFNIDTSGFLNTLNGSFAVVLGGGEMTGDDTQVYLTYTAVPEPSVTALFGGLGLLVLLRRRR